jgi:hypothetical protein
MLFGYALTALFYDDVDDDTAHVSARVSHSWTKVMREGR